MLAPLVRKTERAEPSQGRADRANEFRAFCPALGAVPGEEREGAGSSRGENNDGDLGGRERWGGEKREKKRKKSKGKG